MGELAFSRLDERGRGITSCCGENALSLTIVFTAVGITCRAASNTASANRIVPVAIAVAQAAGSTASARARGTLGASWASDGDLDAPECHNLFVGPRDDHHEMRHASGSLSSDSC